MSDKTPKIIIDTSFKGITDMSAEEIEEEFERAKKFSATVDEFKKSLDALQHALQPMHELIKTQRNNALNYDVVFIEEMIFAAPESFKDKSDMDNFILLFWSDYFEDIFTVLRSFFEYDFRHLTYYFESSLNSFKSENYLACINLIYAIIDCFVNDQFYHLKTNPRHSFFQGIDAIKKIRKEFKSFYEVDKPLRFVEADIALNYLNIVYSNTAQNRYDIPRRNDLIHASFKGEVSKLNCINSYLSLFILIQYRLSTHYPMLYEIV